MPSEYAATLQSSLSTPPASPLLVSVGHPFVSIGVTCRHQLPIRQCNILPILPPCDCEILEWSKLTNLIYRASINKEIVPSLIALLNNGCLFGNHFPISHHFPSDRPRRVFSFCFLVPYLFLNTLISGYLDLKKDFTSCSISASCCYCLIAEWMGWKPHEYHACR